MTNISVVICTYNRAKFIGEALESLAKQTLSPDKFEIIIVNNNCTDNTESICRAFIKNHLHLDINYVIESNQGLSFARNRGIKEAKYEVVTYIDDDAYAKPNFLDIISAYFTDHKEIVGVGGKITPRYEIEEPVWMNKYLYGFVTKIDLSTTERRYEKGEFPTGCNMSYRKGILEEVGGFNNKLKWRADDKYIGFKVKEVSSNLMYLPYLEVEHSIDAYRTTDANFRALSLKFGTEESIRVRDEGVISFIKKLIEFKFKLVGSFILMLIFMLKLEFKKGIYTFRYRWLALIGLLFPNRFA